MLIVFLQGIGIYFLTLIIELLLFILYMIVLSKLHWIANENEITQRDVIKITLSFLLCVFITLLGVLFCVKNISMIVVSFLIVSKIFELYKVYSIAKSKMI